VAAYEQLRLEALGVAVELHRGLGMMVLLGEGMKRWVEAIQETKSYAQRVQWSPTPTSPPVPLSVQEEATRILVNMAMRS
jgi:hypothetical protein